MSQNCVIQICTYMFGRRKRQKYIDLDKARRIWVGFFYHQYWRNGREFAGRYEEDSAYLVDDCASQWLQDEFGGLSNYTIIDCLEELLEYEKEHPDEIDPILKILQSRRSDGSVRMVDSNCQELMEKKKRLLEKISSQRKWILKKREESRIANEPGYNPYYPSRETGADFGID